VLLLIIKVYGKQKFVWFCYVVVFISTLILGKRLPVLPVFIVKIVWSGVI